MVLADVDIRGILYQWVMKWLLPRWIWFFTCKHRNEKVFSDLNVCSFYQREHNIHLGCSAKGVKNPDNLCTDLIELGPWLQWNETKPFQLWFQRRGKGSVSPVKITLLGYAMEYIVKWQMSEPQWARASLKSLLKNLLLATCKNGFLREGSFTESCWGAGESQEVPKEHMRYKKCKVLIYICRERQARALFYLDLIKTIYGDLVLQRK